MGLLLLGSVEASLCLDTGAVLGDVASLCLLDFSGGFRSPWPSTAILIPIYGGAVTCGYKRTNEN